MADIAQFALLALTSLLFIVNPIGVIPTYLVVTQKETSGQRVATARRACISAACILIAFAAGGSHIFRIFGITMDSFRIAGGFILWVVAMGMLHGQRSTQENERDIAEGSTKEDVALTPLAMPMLAGPGAISTIMVLAGQASSMPQYLAVYASILITMTITWVVLRLGERLVARISETGIRVMTRIMGLLLAAVAVQFIIKGAGDTLRAVQR